MANTSKKLQTASFYNVPLFKETPSETSPVAFPILHSQVQTPAWDGTRPWGSSGRGHSNHSKGRLLFPPLLRLHPLCVATLLPPTPHTHPNPDESQPHAALLHAPLSLITASTIHCAVTHTSISLVDTEQDSQDGLISLR